MLRDLCFGKEKKMRFSRKEVVFNRLEIRGKAANIAEIKKEKSRRSIKTCRVVYGKAGRPGGISGPPPQQGTPRLLLFCLSWH